jgi:Mg-chelatase subunit ChlD
MSGGAPSDDGSRADDRYRGFSLRSVCWGYRDIFRKALDGLLDDGVLGDERAEVTRTVFELLKRADQTCYDHVLKEFLGALNPETRWLMDIPEVFVDVVTLGSALSDEKLYYGIEFFRTLGRGEVGRTPAQVRLFMDCMKRLLAVDHELAFAFLKGFARLSGLLSGPELHVYLDHGLQAFARNRATGIGYMALTLKSAEAVVRTISKECRLSDVAPTLQRLLRPLVGYDVEVSGLGALDSDHLIEHGSRFVCMYRWCYVPDRLRHFDDAGQNARWYMLLAVVGAGSLAFDSFSKLHGHPQYQTIESVAGGDAMVLNCLIAVECARVLHRIRKTWPGARRLVEFGLRCELGASPATSDADRLACDLMAEGATPDGAAGALRRIAEESVNVFDSAQRIAKLDLGALRSCYPRLAAEPIRCFAFLPDWRYPGEVSAPPSDALVADMRQNAERARERSDDEPSSKASPPGGEESEESPEREAADAVAQGFLYDEWSQPENDYYRDYCIVREDRPRAPGACELPPGLLDEANEVRKLFEKLKPQLARRQKRLEDGDSIDVDRLLRFLVERRREAQPATDFYERVRINRRDIAVTVLLDVSGSTGESQEAQKVIDLEKRAALALGHGLAALGDTFSICGFSGSGRENCSYFVYKDFDEAWDRDAERNVWAAHPVSSTRIGPALRHAGYRLSERGERQRLTILVTDGKPMDSGYDPSTRYAQHDVRMACLENERQGIHTIAISTDENTVADMEIMFPHRRFVILCGMSRLPAVLPHLYVKIAV